NETWELLAASADRSACYGIVMAAMDAELTDIAEQTAFRGDALGDDLCTFAAGVLLAARGELEGAAEFYSRAAHLGNSGAALDLGKLLEGRDKRGAEAAYRRAAELGNPEAAYRLAMILTERGEHAQAETFLKQAAEGGHAPAFVPLARYAVGRGDYVEAERLL